MNRSTKNITVAAVSMTIAILLPFLTGQIPQIGAMLLPMHLAILMCGFLCDPFYAGLTGAVSPILRFFVFGMPPVFPIGIAMSFELMTYGIVVSLMNKKFGIYKSLITAMILGRIVWGIVMSIIAGVSTVNFGLEIFLTGAFLNAAPGIILQLILIPTLVTALRKRGIYGKEISEADRQN